MTFGGQRCSNISMKSYNLGATLSQHFNKIVQHWANVEPAGFGKDIRALLFIALCFVCSNGADPKVIPAVLTSSVSLECHITQTSTVVWEHVNNTNQNIIALNGTIVLGRNQTKFFVQVLTDRQSLIIHSLALQDDGIYKCRDVKIQGSEQIFKVNILVKPTRVQLLPPHIGRVDEGSDLILTCEADGGKPQPIFEWYILGPTRNRTTLPSATSDKPYLNGTSLSKSQVVIQNVDKSLYRTSVLCIAELPYFFIINNTIDLDVYLFPQVPTFKDFNGIFDDGQTKTVTCESRGSRPAAKLTWFINGKTLTGAIDHVSESPDKTFVVTSTITHTFDKSMDGYNLTCKAMNDVLKRQNRAAVSRTIVLRASYMPILHAVNGTMDVYEHNRINLQCSVDARPMSLPNQVVWLKSGKNIIPDNRIHFNYSATDGQFDLHIHEIRRFDIGQYQCQASNRLGIGRSPPLALNVFYRPVCLEDSIEKHAASIGQTVTLTCRVTSNPSNVTVTWRYKTRSRIIKENQPSFKDPSLAKTSTSSIQIKVSLDIDYTDIECVASNSIGTMLQPCLYMIVKPGPPDAPKNCSIRLLDQTHLRIQCTAGFSGGGQQHFILQKVHGVTFTQVQNSSDPMFDVNNLSPGQNYTYRVCASSETYNQIVSCSYTLSVTTDDENGYTRQDPVAKADTGDTTLYIVGGIVGFLVLLCLVLIILCVIKKRQQLNSNTRGTHTEVHRQTRDNHSIYVDFDKVAKLEEHVAKAFDNKDHKGHNTYEKHESKNLSSDNNIVLQDQVTTLQHFTLQNLASTCGDSSMGKPTKIDATHQRGTGIDPDVVYTLPVKRNQQQEDHQNPGFIYEEISDVDDIVKSRSKSMESLAGSKHDLCYSEGDINKALQRELSENHDLASVTKSLRKSTSLHELTDTSKINITHEECDTPSDRNKHPNGADIAHIGTLVKETGSKEMHDATRKNTYNTEDKTEEKKNRNRRRSYNLAILDDGRNSKNIQQENNIDDDVFIPDPTSESGYYEEEIEETKRGKVERPDVLVDDQNDVLQNEYSNKPRRSGGEYPDNSTFNEGIRRSGSTKADSDHNFNSYNDKGKMIADKNIYQSENKDTKRSDNIEAYF